MDSREITQIENFMKMHEALIEDGHRLPARKTRYALGAYFDGILERMAESDGGKGMRTTDQPDPQLDIEDQIALEEAEAKEEPDSNEQELAGVGAELGQDSEDREPEDPADGSDGMFD